jgi:hypothetical protein
MYGTAIVARVLGVLLSILTGQPSPHPLEIGPNYQVTNFWNLRRPDPVRGPLILRGRSLLLGVSLGRGRHRPIIVLSRRG